METHNNVKPPSTLTVLEKSRELHILLSKVVVDENLLNKIFRYSVGKCVTDHSQDIYESLAVANSLDLYDKELTAERLRYQTQARRAVTKLIASLRVLYTISQMPADKMKILLDKTIEVERLLKKWIESDRNRVNSCLSIVKKDEIDTTIFKREVTAHELFAPSPHVDFDLLLKDSRRNLPPVVGANGRTPYIPPGETIQTQTPPVKYVVKSDADRIKEIEKGIFDLGRIDTKLPPMPMSDRPRHETAVAARIIPETTKPTVEVTVRDKPIIVPDNRLPPPPPIPTKEEQDNEPLSPNVLIQQGGTPDMLVEDRTILPVDTEGSSSAEDTQPPKVTTPTDSADKPAVASS